MKFLINVSLHGCFDVSAPHSSQLLFHIQIVPQPKTLGIMGNNESVSDVTGLILMSCPKDCRNSTELSHDDAVV